MVNMPKNLLPQRDTWVRRYLGQGPDGDVYEDEFHQVDRSQVRMKNHLIRTASGDQAVAAGQIIFLEGDGPFHEDDEVKIFVGRPMERAARAVGVEFLEGPPLPSHWVVHFA